MLTPPPPPPLQENEELLDYEEDAADVAVAEGGAGEGKK